MDRSYPPLTGPGKEGILSFKKKEAMAALSIFKLWGKKIFYMKMPKTQWKNSGFWVSLKEQAFLNQKEQITKYFLDKNLNLM